MKKKKKKTKIAAEEIRPTDYERTQREREKQ